jgi:hypothetical protein
MNNEERDKSSTELSDAEANIYSEYCGKVQVTCEHDCLDGSSWIAIEW